MQSTNIPEVNPTNEALGRLVFVFAHRSLDLKLFTGLARKDKTNIVVECLIKPDGGSKLALLTILSKIEQGIEDYVN